MFRSRSALIIVILLAATAVTSAQITDVPRIRFKQICQVRANGDVDFANNLIFSLQTYTNLKKMVGNTQVLLRELGVSGQTDVIANARAEYDDSRNAIRVTGTIVGGVKNRGQSWFAEVWQAEDFEEVDMDPDAVTLLGIAQLDNGTLIVGTTRIEFPEGVTDIQFEPSRGGVSFRMPPVPAETEGPADVDMEIEVRPELMGCLYKIYGNPKFSNLWVARAVFRNRGTTTIQDFRVRFRLPEYSSWSGWKQSRIVYPSQTVVEVFYPIVAHTVRDLTSATPASLEIEWSYKGPDGQLVEETDSRRLSVLGLNEVIFSNLPSDECTNWFESFNLSPLIGASFVSHNDPIIQQFCGMAAKMAGGVAASSSNENAITFMKGVYDLMCANQIKYHTPPGLFDKAVRQHVKFGRDVLRNRAGTCIDLAILYASTCEAGGLAPCLVMIPGHCFPAIKLPQGGIQAVEATVVSGTNDGQMVPFEKAAQIGQKELAEAVQNGLFYLVDIQKLRKDGVPTPELPGLATSALVDWGIKAPDQQQTVPVAQPPQQGFVPAQNGQAPQPAPQPNVAMQPVQAPDGSFAMAVPGNWIVQWGNQQGVTMLNAGDPNPVNNEMERPSLVCMAAPAQGGNLQQFCQNMIATWQQSVPGWTPTGQELVQLGGRQGVHIQATCAPGGVALVADYYLVMSEQRQVALTIACPQNQVAQWQPIFQQIAATLQVP